MRIDKYLWAIRVFKTRTMATTACKNSKVLINDVPVKAARDVEPGQVVQVRKEAVWYHYQVLGLPKSRVGAKLVEEYRKDVTPEDQLVKLTIMRQNNNLGRARGEGRPTKKERRDLDKFRD